MVGYLSLIFLGFPTSSSNPKPSKHGPGIHQVYPRWHRLFCPVPTKRTTTIRRLHVLHVVNAVTGRYGGRIGLGDIKQGQSDVRSMLGPNSCRMFKPCQVYPDEHVCVSPQETRIFIGKMHVTVEHLDGELPAKFAAKFLSEVRSVSMRQSLQRRIRKLLDALIFLFKNNKTQPKFHNKLHHAPQPQIQQPPGGQIFSTNLGFQFVGPFGEPLV